MAEETSAKQAGEIVGLARRHVTQALDAAAKAEKLLGKIPADKRSNWANLASETRIAANEAQQILYQIETKAAKKYLMLAVNAANTAQSMSTSARLEAAKVKPGAKMSWAREALKNAQTSLAQAQQGVERLKEVVKVMKGGLPFGVGLGVTPRSKAEISAATQYRDTAIQQVKAAESAVQYAKEKLIDLEAFSIPKAAKTEAKIISITPVEKDVKKASDDGKKTKKALDKEENKIEKIIRDINIADRDLAGVLQRVSVIKSKPPTSAEIAAFNTQVIAFENELRILFSSIKNRTKELAEKVWGKDFKSHVENIEQDSVNLVAGYTGSLGIIEKLRPLSTSPEAQAKLAEIEKSLSDVQVHIRILREATARLSQGHLQQYDNMRTQCLLLNAVIQKREKFIEGYANTINAEAKNLAALQVPKGEKKPVDTGRLNTYIRGIDAVLRSLHEELRGYDTNFQRIKDHISISAETIKTIGADIEECRKAMSDIKKPAKELQKGILELQKLIKQIQEIPPPTAGVEYRR